MWTRGRLPAPAFPWPPKPASGHFLLFLECPVPFPAQGLCAHCAPTWDRPHMVSGLARPVAGATSLEIPEGSPLGASPGAAFVAVCRVSRLRPPPQSFPFPDAAFRFRLLSL